MSEQADSAAAERRAANRARVARGEPRPWTDEERTRVAAPPHPVLKDQVYERVPMLMRDGTRWKSTVRGGSLPEHTRIVITSVPGGRRTTIRYRKLDPRRMGNGRADRGEHPITLTTLARHYQLVSDPPA